MMFHVNVRKSKQKNVTKAAREQYEQWLASHQKPIIKKLHTPNTKLAGYSLSAPPGRETKHYPSLDTGLANASKSKPKIYTGTKVIGIATLHKSNAVPVFSDEQAVEISRMRRG
jgi:hypothetical protein